ncbi:hypothetical protein [Saccharothrix australiensis]|uniref:Uncharacterized protein n=1 Tax=Saccharothrix australiensis TaxID=2072 RepID=A0A495W6X6_9PSEU|nr:hypothetical protein [Saccharothrix australiensis]RKT55558.1 hypothetical protein C8E97_4234 [Saccharothrix australiensis]
MEHELYVMALVKSSERARAAVGGMARSDLLRHLASAGRAAEEWAELAARIRTEFTPPPLPAALTQQHLRALLTTRSIAALAEVLRCPVPDVHETLLDPERLEWALRDSGSNRRTIRDAERMLMELIPRLPRLAAAHALSSGDWGWFVERHGWLTAHAVRCLTAHARYRGWPADARPAQVLAAVLDEVDGPRTEVHDSARFDSLALIELRRRIGLLAEQLRDDALSRAEEAALLAPDLASVSRLPAWLQLYEQNAVAIGLHRLFTGATSLAELLQGAYSEPPPVVGDPLPAKGFGIENEISFGVFKRRVAFDVTCEVEGHTGPQVVLRCRGLPRDAHQPVRAKILQLRTSDLSQIGSSVGERLLNTRVAQHHGLRGRLRLALHQHGAEAIQAVLLTGIRRPISVPAPWRDHLETALPFAEPPAHDTGFGDVGEVNRALRDSAGDRRVEEVT